MSFTVSFTGQRENEGIWVESLDQAVARVEQFKPGQFPASTWEIPDGQDLGNGHLVRKYPGRPSGDRVPGT
jgi:hypothetical protein